MIAVQTPTVPDPHPVAGQMVTATASGAMHLGFLAYHAVVLSLAGAKLAEELRVSE